SDFMRAVGDGSEVLQIRTAEGDMRDAHEEGLLVDGGEDFFERNGHAVGRGDRDDPRALSRKAVVDVVVRGEVEAIGDEFVAGAAPIETGGNDRLADGNILMHHDAAFWRSDD